MNPFAPVQILAMAAIALVVMLAAVGYVFWEAAKAPRGHEDPDGFHYDPEPPDPAGKPWRCRLQHSAAGHRSVLGEVHHRPPC